jgi:large repetitive protein
MAARKHLLSAVPLLVAAVFACVPASALATEPLKEQTIKFTSTPPNPARVNGTYEVTATGGASGNPVTFSLDVASEGCELKGSTVHFLATTVSPGKCTIDANQAGNSQYSAAPTATQPIEIKPATQAVKFTTTPPAKGFVGGAQYSVAAQGGASGEPVELTVDATSTSVCSMPGTTSPQAVTFTGAGTCTIDANQKGNANYEAAPQQQQSIAVKRTQTITVKPPSSMEVGTVYKPEAEATSHEPVTIATPTESVCTASGSTVTFVAQGACELRYSQAGNAEYEPTQYVQKFEVVKGPQTITFTSLPPEPTLVGFNYVPAATAPSGNQVTFKIDPASTSICTETGPSTAPTIKFVAGGTCTIDASVAESTNYAAGTGQQQVTVVKSSQAIEFTSSSPAPALVGGTYSVSARSTSTLPVSFSSATPSVCTVSGSTVRLVGGGTCTINADQSGSAVWAPAPEEHQSFAVLVVATGPRQPGPNVPVNVVSPNSNFKVVAASLSLATYSITFVESVSDPGTFNWVLTFENGKFGNFAASINAKKCKAGWIKLKGKCRPARVLFGQGRETVTAAGSVTFTVHPTKAAVSALRNAFKLNKGLPVTAHVTYQSTRGGSPVARVQSLIVKGKR